MPKPLEISLKDLKTWLEDETSPILEPIRKEGTDLLHDTREKLEEFRDSCEKLLEDSEKETLKGSPKTYRRARTACKFSRDVLEAIDELDIPDSITYEKIRTLCGDMKKTFEAIGQERARRYRHISPYFILDRRRFDSALSKAMDSLKELRNFSADGYAPARAVEDSFAIIDKIVEASHKLDRIRKRKMRAESKTKVVQKKIDETERKVASIRSKDAVIELAQTREEIKKLEETLERKLRYLEKPFLKFQKLVQGPGYRLPLNETKKLNQYMKDPLKALATEKRGYPELRRILRGMEDAMAKGKLRLKRSRLRKAQEKINDILKKNSLIPLHENCSEAFSKKQQLVTSKTVATSRSRRKKLEAHLERLEKRKELADSRMAVLDRRYEAELEDIKSRKKELENAVLNITGKSIRVAL